VHSEQMPSCAFLAGIGESPNFTSKEDGSTVAAASFPKCGGAVNKECSRVRLESGIPQTTAALVNAGWRPVYLGGDLWTDGRRRAQVWRSGPQEFVLDVTSPHMQDT
jgi:hypothetical protein